MLGLQRIKKRISGLGLSLTDMADGNVDLPDWGRRLCTEKRASARDSESNKLAVTVVVVNVQLNFHPLAYPFDTIFASRRCVFILAPRSHR